MKDIIIWGAAGQAIVLEEFLDDLGYRIIAFFDNNEMAKSISDDIPIFYGTNGFEEWMKSKKKNMIHGIVAIGGAKGIDRFEIQKEIQRRGIIIATLIHPNANVAKNVIIGKGSQILSNATISARAIVGEASIVNTSASIDHECEIGNGVHIGPGARLAGCIKISDFTFIGTGAIVLPRISIGKNTIIGAGSIVNKDLPDDVVAFGSPAKIIRRNDEH